MRRITPSIFLGFLTLGISTLAPSAYAFRCVMVPAAKGRDQFSLVLDSAADHNLFGGAQGPLRFLCHTNPFVKNDGRVCSPEGFSLLDWGFPAGAKCRVEGLSDSGAEIVCRSGSGPGDPVIEGPAGKFSCRLPQE